MMKPYLLLSFISPLPRFKRGLGFLTHPSWWRFLLFACCKAICPFCILTIARGGSFP